MKGTLSIMMRFEMKDDKAIEDFARMMKVLAEHGYREQVQQVLDGFEEEMKRRGLPCLKLVAQ